MRLRWPKRRLPVTFVALILALVFLSGCAEKVKYLDLSPEDRRTGLEGLSTLFARYLEKHPESWKNFARILTEADDALNAHTILTKAEVMRWIDTHVKKEGFKEKELPGLALIRLVYLRGWEHAYFSFVDDQEREMLSDLIGAVMGGMHKYQSGM
jgi:hypothetical protein